jgi:hypothetical protein
VAEKPTKIQSFLLGLHEVEQREAAKRAVRDLISGVDNPAVAVERIRALSESADPVARRFMRALGEFVAKLDPEDYK